MQSLWAGPHIRLFFVPLKGSASGRRRPWQRRCTLRLTFCTVQQEYDLAPTTSSFFHTGKCILDVAYCRTGKEVAGENR